MKNENVKVREGKYLDGINTKRGLPLDFIKKDAEQRLLEPLFDFGGEVEVKFESEKDVQVYLIGATDEKSWINTAYEINSATWTKDVIDKAAVVRPLAPDYESKQKFTIRQKLEVLKNDKTTVPFEAFTAQVAIRGITRAMSVQIERHRQGGFGESAMRVNDWRKASVRIPLSLVESNDSELINKYKETIIKAYEVYAEMVDKGIPFEEARNILPLGHTTYLTITGNLRFWIDYFNARIQDIAQYEHQIIAYKIMDLFRTHLPLVWEIIETRLYKKPDFEHFDYK